MILSQEELIRYSRHIRLPQIGQAGQEKLKKSRVLIIGMGGLGSPVSLYLAAAGVGRLGLADFDKVELHNLQRQILHDSSSLQESKLESAQKRLNAINPEVELALHPEGVTLGNAVELISQYDLVVDGSDNFPTRYLVSDACFFAQRPLVYGSIFQFEGQASFFHPHDGGPCYRCLFPKMPEPGSVPNCEQAGVFGALCGIIGSLQSMEAIKHLAQIGESLKGRLLVWDTLNASSRTLKLKKDPHCPICSSAPQITELKAENYDFTCTPTHEQTTTETNMDNIPIEIDITTAQSLSEATFLDVREDFELDICKIDQALHIPMGQIGERHTNLPKEKPLVVFCHHGGRSLRVAQYLRSVGFDNATSMRGGVDGWALQCDPEMARY